MNQNGGKQAHPALGAADWISLAAAPTFAIMALVTGIRARGMPEVLCSATQDASPLTGMVSYVFADERFPFGAMAETDLLRGKHRPAVMAQDFVSLEPATFLRRCGGTAFRRRRSWASRFVEHRGASAYVG